MLKPSVDKIMGVFTKTILKLEALAEACETGVEGYEKKIANAESKRRVKNALVTSKYLDSITKANASADKTVSKATDKKAEATGEMINAQNAINALKKLTGKTDE